MAKRRTIGNIIAGPRFVTFITALIVGVFVGTRLLNDGALGILVGFDFAAALFLLLCLPLLGTRDGRVIEAHAAANDANRTLLLALSAVVVAVLLIVIAIETVGRDEQTPTKALVVVTLAVAWLFINSVYALHYAHLAYTKTGQGCEGLAFRGRPSPSIGTSSTRLSPSE